MEKKIQGPQSEQKGVESYKEIPSPLREEEKEKELILTDNEEESKFEETNVLPFNRPALGSKDTEDNWLFKLAVRTCFLCRPKPGPTTHSIIDLVEYHVVFKTENGAVKLLSNQNEDKFFWVDSARFSRQMELFKILGVSTDEYRDDGG